MNLALAGGSVTLPSSITGYSASTQTWTAQGGRTKFAILWDVTSSSSDICVIPVTSNHTLILKGNAGWTNGVSVSTYAGQIYSAPGIVFSSVSYPKHQMDYWYTSQHEKYWKALQALYEKYKGLGICESTSMKSYGSYSKSITSTGSYWGNEYNSVVEPTSGEPEVFVGCYYSSTRYKSVNTSVCSSGVVGWTMYGLVTGKPNTGYGGYGWGESASSAASGTATDGSISSLSGVNVYSFGYVPILKLISTAEISGGAGTVDEPYILGTES